MHKFYIVSGPDRLDLFNAMVGGIPVAFDFHNEVFGAHDRQHDRFIITGIDVEFGDTNKGLLKDGNTFTLRGIVKSPLPIANKAPFEGIYKTHKDVGIRGWLNIKIK